MVENQVVYLSVFLGFLLLMLIVGIVVSRVLKVVKIFSWEGGD